MKFTLADILKISHFDHRWLTDEQYAHSQSHAEDAQTKKQHYLPQMYLRRWAFDGYVQPVQITTGSTHPPQPPKDVAHKKNFYSLPTSIDSIDLPSRWIEVYLSQIESYCAHHLDDLISWDSGVYSSDLIKRDMSVFLGLQLSRTPNSRQQSDAIIRAPDRIKQQFLRSTYPKASAGELERSMRARYNNPKQEALSLMLTDVKNVTAFSIYFREWAVYRTADPLITCDDPVVTVAGPPHARGDNPGSLFSAAILFPLSPFHLLVMLRPDRSHRGPYRLNKDETRGVNIEIAYSATKTTFERPGDNIAANIAVPPHPERARIDTESILHLSSASALREFVADIASASRWKNSESNIPWPVSRWYKD